MQTVGLAFQSQPYPSRPAITKPLTMLRRNYYISGHGNGHATRSAQPISLPIFIPAIHVTVITTASSPASPRICFVPQKVNSAIIQPQLYTIGAIASSANLASVLEAAETEV